MVVRAHCRNGHNRMETIEMTLRSRVSVGNHNDQSENFLKSSKELTATFIGDLRMFIYFLRECYFILSLRFVVLFVLSLTFQCLK